MYRQLPIGSPPPFSAARLPNEARSQSKKETSEGEGAVAPQPISATTSATTPAISATKDDEGDLESMDEGQGGGGGGGGEKFNQ